MRDIMDITAVDSHAHVMRRGLPLAPDRHSEPKRDCTVEEYLAVLDAHDISHGLLTAPSFYGTDNTLLLDALDRAAGRLRGTVIVAPDIDRAALEAMDARGAVGIRLNWFRRASLPDAASANYRRLFAAVRDLGWHVEIYIEGPLLAPLLPQIRASGAKVVVDHFGGPAPARGVACAGFQRVLEGVRAGDTFVKLSGSYRQGGADCQPYVDALLDAGGPQQLVWASDWPFLSHEDHVTYEDCVNDLRTWVPDAATRRIILAETPVKLFGFDRPLPATRRNTEKRSP
ncbi:MAG TPA: amidohydrolase family protein [Casimicrobiaceae bacterium]|nr:amidohydrolase family protein [Casimicrobiaceae bacterium]